MRINSAANRLPNATPGIHSNNQATGTERLRRYVESQGGQFDASSGDYELDSIHFKTFPGREGYDESFLGTEVKLPEIDSSMADQVARRIDDPEKSELEYTHHSVVLNKMRRMPFFTAVNVDGSSSQVLHDKVKWSYEGRVAFDDQLGNIAYTKNTIDRGHMVHGQSPAWGENGETARADTYVYTNVAPQHAKLNQGKWLDLENQILEQAEARGQKVSIFAGPVFQKDDPFFNNHGKMPQAVQMPRSFWKVLVWNDPKNGLRSKSYVMSQAEDLKSNEGPKSHIPETNLEQYRVPLSRLEQLTKLHFQSLEGTDA